VRVGLIFAGDMDTISLGDVGTKTWCCQVWGLCCDFKEV
jgi:hypothetical protein